MDKDIRDLLTAQLIMILFGLVIMIIMIPLQCPKRQSDIQKIEMVADRCETIIKKSGKYRRSYTRVYFHSTKNQLLYKEDFNSKDVADIVFNVPFETTHTTYRTATGHTTHRFIGLPDDFPKKPH